MNVPHPAVLSLCLGLGDIVSQVVVHPEVTLGIFETVFGDRGSAFEEQEDGPRRFVGQFRGRTGARANYFTPPSIAAGCRGNRDRPPPQTARATTPPVLGLDDLDCATPPPAPPAHAAASASGSSQMSTSLVFRSRPCAMTARPPSSSTRRRCASSRTKRFAESRFSIARSRQ